MQNVDYHDGLMPGIALWVQNPDDLPRGIRNANPGNIKASETFAWRGQCGRDVKGFCLFRTAFWGIRAMGVILHNYVEHHGLLTIQQCAIRWSGDDMPVRLAYSSYVAAQCGIPDDQATNLLELSDRAITAMIAFENACTINGLRVSAFYKPEYVKAAVCAAHLR